MTTNPETETPTPNTTELQRPDLGIETVTAGPSVVASREAFPWIKEEKFEVSTSKVKLAEGEEFNYGSLIGANNTLSKLANGVDLQSSVNAEQGLFKAIASVLRGDQHPNIDHVPDELSATPIFKVSKSGRDAPRLFFTVLPSDKEGELPTVLRLAIAGHKKQGEAAAVITARSKKNYGADGKKR